MTNLTLETITVTTDDRGVATLKLNRPEKHNALNGALIAEVHQAADALAADDRVRIVILTGADCSSFCAGGDFNWFKSVASADREIRKQGGLELARMLQALNTLPKPLIGRINGSAYGGGTGMISVCDYTIGVTGSRFGLTEVRLGLIPATISPYVVARVGVPNARAVMLSGALFSAQRGGDIGLLNEVVDPSDLDPRVDAIVADHLEAAPGAVAATKKLIEFVASHESDENIEYTASALADAWETEEGQTGIAAFLGKTIPPWRSGK